MNCPNPRFARYYDGFTGECKTLRFGCGRCAACLAAQQDSWAIRLGETASRSEHFLYTTLTFSPEAFEKHGMLLDISDALLDPDFTVYDQTVPVLDYWFDRYGFGNLPLFEKKLLSSWIKRGRENYFADTGERLNFKYMFVMEYGPKNSRPHAHGIIFGLKRSVYDKYFNKPWQSSFGFTDLKYINRKSKRGFQKSAACISRYISKYINKGVFESPLVKNALLPKCWRLISNGIGAEYLESPRFDFTRTLEFAIAREMFSQEDPFLRESRRLCANSSDPGFYIADSRCQSLPDFLLDSNPFSGIELPYSVSQLKNLCIYVDDSNYPHVLPRYYRDRLLGRTSNLLRYLIQDTLLQDARERRDSQVSGLASSIEGSQACRDLAAAYNWGLSRSAYYLASLKLDIAEHEKAVRCEARHFNNMINHYIRPKRYSGRKRINLLQ